jgi:hypothetical protein
MKTDDGAKEKGAKTTTPSAEVIQLAQKIQALPAHRRYLLEELVNQLQDKL